MSSTVRTTPLARDAVGYAEGFAANMRRTFSYMFMGVGMTAFIMWYLTTSPELMNSLFNISYAMENGERVTHYNPGMWYVGAIILELVLVLFVSGMALSSSSGTAALAVFFGYAALNGVTIAPFVAAYTGASVFQAFAAAAAMFGASALYGLTTKRDLTSLGDFLFMALIGVLIVLVINAFMRSPMVDYIISIGVVGLFVVITAFDVQDQRRMYHDRTATSSEGLAVFGALSLYLDFINMFVYLLRIIGVKVND